MAQKIKVQDGVVVYSTSDPSAPQIFPNPSTGDIDFLINGQLGVSLEVAVGNDPLADGSITSPTLTDIRIIPGNHLSLETPNGSLLLNNVSWPVGLPNNGQILVASGLNTLSYGLLVLGIVGSDTLTDSQLNVLFPAAIPGQSAAGPTVVYLCVSTGVWRKSASALGFVPVNKAGDSMTGYLILNADPVDPLGAVTKQYADNIAAGVNIHEAARTSTAGTLAIESGGTVTYNNGAAGVGATLTTTGSFGTIGTVALFVGDRVLVKDEVSQVSNGVYTYTSASVLTRATDFDGSPNSEVQAGDLVYVQEGTFAGTSWVQITPGTISIGTSNIVFTQFSGPIPGQAITINTQANDYTLQLSDAFNTLIRMTKATATILTIPNDSTVNMPIGSAVLIGWNGLGQVSIAAEVGVTVDTPDTYNIGKQFGKITAIKTGANHWEIEGNLEPV